MTNDLESLRAENERLRKERDASTALADRLKLEAQGHAGEARTANTTIYEIYQVLSGSSGEPGNWHGAEPARAFVAATKAKLEEAAKVLEPFAAKVDWPLGGILDGFPIQCHAINPSYDTSGTYLASFCLFVSDFRAAKSFLANLKGAE